MDSERITDVTYLQGHSSYGVCRINMTLWANAASLSFMERGSRQPLFSIPWTNLRDLKNGHVLKEGWRYQVAFWTPLYLVMPAETGIWITYWDQEVQRDQKFFVTTGDESRADRLINALWAYRDNFVRYMETQSHPIKSGH
jgi:hypothetical protein